MLALKKCKNIQETSILLLELERRIEEVVETRGDPPDNTWMTTILLTAMDERTRTHCSTGLREDTSFMSMETIVLAFIHLVSGTSTVHKSKDAVDIDQIGERQ